MSLTASIAQAQHTDSSGDKHDEDHDDSDHGDSGSKSKGQGGAGKGGGHDDDGHDSSGHEDDGHESGDHDEGSDDHGSSGKKGLNSDGGQEAAKGEGSGAGQSSDRAGIRPPWAKEGIPEVELGRLNVARSPTRVLDRAYDEALASFTAEKVAFYNLSLEEAAQVLRTDFRNVSMIDSPLQNLALLRDVLENGNSVLNSLEQVSNSNGNLAAIFLGTAADKTIAILPESAYALGRILGIEMTEAQARSLAKDAEFIRQAIAAGHG